MSTRGDILRRAAQVEPDAVPEPWRSSDDEDALATVSDREHYRKNLVTLPDGAGGVPAYVWDFPRTPSIPDEVREEWTRGSAGRVLGPDGKYVSRESDVPRKSFDGEDPGLLVEEGGRTNPVLDSAKIDGSANWNYKRGGQRKSTGTSVIERETAYEVEGTTSNETAQIFQKSIGTFSSGVEVVSIIVEQSTSDKIRIRIQEEGNFNSVAEVEYIFSNSSTTLSVGQEVNVRTLQATGPNGGELLRFVIQYDPTSGTDFSGIGRRLVLLPDKSGNNNATYFHHAQIEEAPNASSPIVTGSSAQTRAGDDYAISVGDWINPNEGTWLIEITNRTTSSSTFNSRVLGFPTAKLEFQGVTSPYDIRTQDSSNEISVGVGMSFFQTRKIAFSVTLSETRLSVDGSSNSGGHNGDFLVQSGGTLVLSDFNTWHKIIYVPRALPESTLNRITS